MDDLITHISLYPKHNKQQAWTNYYNVSMKTATNEKCFFQNHTCLALYLTFLPVLDPTVTKSCVVSIHNGISEV